MGVVGRALWALEQTLAIEVTKNAIHANQGSHGEARSRAYRDGGGELRWDVELIPSHLYKQFGSEAASDIHAKGTEYDAGMPEKGQPTFPKGVNIPEKLRQLAHRQKLLWDIFKLEKQETYVYC